MLLETGVGVIGVGWGVGSGVGWGVGWGVGSTYVPPPTTTVPTIQGCTMQK